MATGGFIRTVAAGLALAVVGSAGFTMAASPAGATQPVYLASTSGASAGDGESYNAEVADGSGAVAFLSVA